MLIIPIENVEKQLRIKTQKDIYLCDWSMLEGQGRCGYFLNKF